MRFVLLTFFLISIKTFSFSQGYYPPVVNYSPQEYSQLVKMNPENYAIVQDHYGIVYFGNSNGIMEYDGKNWRFIPVIIGSFVRSLALDSNNTIYVGTNNNFGYLEPNEKGILKYISLSENLPIEDQFFSNIMSIYTTKTKVFFQSQEAFFEYDIENQMLKAVFSESSFHTSFIVDNEYYLRERQVGIVKWNGNKLETLKGTETIFQEYGCFGIFKGKENSFFIITQEKGLFHYKNDSLYPVFESDDNAINSIRLFHSKKLSDGNYAVGTFTQGVFIINENGDIIHKIDRATGLRSNDIKFMFEDRDQNLWLGLGNGIAKVNYYSPLSYFNEKSGLEGDVQAILRYKNLLFVGTSFGLYIQDNSNDRVKEFSDVPAISDQVWDFEIVNGELFVATTEGIVKLKYLPENIDDISINNFQKIKQINTNKIKYIADKNILITAGIDGIYVWDNNFQLKWIHEDRLSTILSIVIDPENKNLVWVGTSENGAFRIDLSKDYEMENFTSFDGLKDDQRVKPILFNDKLIFGSSGGVLEFLDEEEMKKDLPDSLKDDPDFYRGMFDVYPFYDSVFQAEILLVKEDGPKTWFVAEQKIGYYDLNAKEFVNKPFWGINYGRVNNFYLEEDGTLWIGCADGLIRYKKNERKTYQSSFTSLIREVKIAQDSLLFQGNINKQEKGLVELSYHLNDVHFIFASPYFEDEHTPEFSYILEGKDQVWSDWGTQNEANYTNLHEGDYIFKVKARNIYGQISDEAVFYFSISPPWYRTSLAYIGYFILFILLIFIAIRISSARLKAKNIWLEGVVEERTKEIKDKNLILEHKNHEISEQKKEIEDSINYAKRIQNAILPVKSEMKKHIPNSFVIFRPKDIVSGDFYWFTEQDNKLIIVCADCTGHGVPGAFMSMIGSDRLNIIVNERRQTSPGLILSELNKAIKKSLKQDGSDADSTKDGMDAAICVVDIKSQTLIYAGANRPLWIYENNEVEEIKATKVAVAGFTDDAQIYEEHQLSIKKGMKFYMSTDGYADQFGGPQGKKYKVKAMRDLIIEISQKEFDEQKEIMEAEILNWMNNHDEIYEQIDDICLIGFEI